MENKITELKRTVADFNITCNRMKKAEECFKTCTDKQYEHYLNDKGGYLEIQKESGALKIKLEKLLGRKLTDDEAINGYEI